MRVVTSTPSTMASEPTVHPLPAADWRRRQPEPRRRALRVWLWSIALMTLLTLVIGGITRLTRSGLSIVDWAPIMGVVPPLPGFNQALRGVTSAHGALLILDEVLTGFRAGPAGWWGIEGAAEGWAPDLFTFGKVVGGGLPVAAVAGADGGAKKVVRAEGAPQQGRARSSRG